MKVKAIDQLHVSSVQAAALRKDEEFEVSDAEGEQLIKRGLVTKVAEKSAAKATAKPANKRARPSRNKMAAAPQNQSA